MTLRSLPPLEFDALMHRFMRKVDLPKDIGECWMWIGSVNSSGYGTISVGTRTMQAHRVSYELWNTNPIPDGLVLDHVCWNKSCVNPDHLEPVTQSENNYRTFDDPRNQKTHCKRGHALTPENVIRWRTHRRCKTCHREYQRSYVSPGNRQGVA